MSSRNTVNPKIEAALRKFCASKDKKDFDELYVLIDRNEIADELLANFPGFWKIDKALNIEGGIETLKNDSMLELYKNVMDSEIETAGKMPDFQRKLEDFLSFHKNDFVTLTGELLEYSFSVPYRDYFLLEGIREFSEYALFEIFSIIEDTLAELMEGGRFVLFFHAVLLLDGDRISRILGISDFESSLREEAAAFAASAAKAGLGVLLSVYIKELGDIDEFRLQLEADRNEAIFNERLKMTPFKKIETELSTDGAKERLFFSLNSYLGAVMNSAGKHVLNDPYSGESLTRILCPALLFTTDEFVKELFTRKENINAVESGLSLVELDGEKRRALEKESGLPFGYLEQFGFRMALKELFPSF